MLLFSSICLVIVGLLMGFPILSSALVFCVVYVWCQINKDIIVNFWFGVQVKVRFPSRKSLLCMYIIFLISPHRLCTSLGSYSSFSLFSEQSKLLDSLSLHYVSSLPPSPSNSWASMLMGIVVGHLYFFLTMKYPQEYGGRHFLNTPQIL